MKNPNHKKRADALPPSEATKLGNLHKIENGTQLGRPPGSKNLFPYYYVEALKALNWRVKKEYHGIEAISELNGLTLEQSIKALQCKLPSRKAPTALKAAIYLRSEFCEPIEQNVHVKHSMSIVQALEEIQKSLDEGEELAPKLLPPPKSEVSELEYKVVQVEPKVVPPKWPTIRKKENVDV